jgi:hypothetical protein
VPLRAIARGFEVQSKDVGHALAKGGAMPKGSGEYRSLEDDTEECPLEWIPKNAQNHAPVNRTEVSHDYYETRGAVITGERVDFILDASDARTFRHDWSTSGKFAT